MTFEEYYGADYLNLLNAEKQLNKLAERLKESSEDGKGVTPVVYYCSRIKKPDSMTQKLKSRGFSTSKKSALTNVYDAVGLRIVCAFSDDVKNIVSAICRESQITVIEQKDYLSHPKPNGYRSYHLCVRLQQYDVLAEIQVRTIAMDFWATLEHQIKYKKNIPHEKTIRAELKRCADEIASVDLSMQTIREIIKEND